LSLTVDGQREKQNANIEVSARQLDFNPNTMAVELAELTAKVKAALPGLGQLDASMSAPALQLTEKTAVGESFVVDLALVQPEGRKVNSQLTLRKLAGNLQQNVTGQLAVNLDLDESARKLKFNLSSPLSVNVSEQLVALSGFTGGLDVTDSSLPNGKASMPLTGSLSAGIKKQQVDLELSSTYEATQFNLKAGVNDFTNPFITAAFEADKLDVDALLPPAKEGGKGQKGEGQSTPIDDVPIDLSPLKAMNADATVKVGYLKASGIVVNNLSLRAVSKAGRLTVSPMTANLYEGNSKGSVVADANTNLVTIKQSLSGVQIEPLLKDVLSKDMAAGKGNVEIDLTTKGKTVGAMKAALNGRVAVALTDGAVKGFNLAESLRGAKNLFSGTSSNDTSQADTTKQTDFSSMSVSFNVKDGVATSNDLNLMAPLFRIGGAGTIDLVKNSLDYTANAAIVATSTGQGGKTLDSGLKGLNVPVRLYGGFASVKWEVLLQELAKAALKSKVGSQLEEKKEALKTQVDEQKQEITNQAQEKLKDSLKGFFGR
jgi:AsmA protein